MELLKVEFSVNFSQSILKLNVFFQKKERVIYKKISIFILKKNLNEYSKKNFISQPKGKI